MCVCGYKEPWLAFGAVKNCLCGGVYVWWCGGVRVLGVDDLSPFSMQKYASYIIHEMYGITLLSFSPLCDKRDDLFLALY